MAMRVPVRVPRTFVPQEAHGIAERLRSEAAHIREYANQLRDVRNTLNNTWQGNSKDRFMGEYQAEPDRLDSYAAWLITRANEIEQIKVTVWETK